MEELKVGDIIKQRYTLVQFLGSGSFGEVWLAHDLMTGRDVALKIYLSLDPAGVEEFQREYSNSADLSSPYLLTPEYFDVHNRRPFLVMKFCENGSSSKLSGQISEDRLWTFIHDVASGLEVLHSQSDPIVHQDIKPDNILVDSNGHFLITDFGISKRLRATMRRQSKRDVSSGAMPYMAPERFESMSKLNPASDIWSLGASIYELATGELPLNGFGGSMLKHGAEVPSLGSSVSQSLNGLMMACLSPDFSYRPTAKEIVEAATKKTYLKTTQQKNTQKAVLSSGNSTIKERKTNTTRLLFYSIAFVVVALIGYLICNPYLFNRVMSNEIVPSDTIAANDSSIVPDSTSVSEVIIEDKEMQVNEKSLVPKPQKVNGPNNLPFNPAGCPSVYVKGANHEVMTANKSIDANIYGRDYTFTIGDNHPNGIRALVIGDGYGYNLFMDLDFNEEDNEIFFDEFGFLNEDCNMQLTAMDFNNDGECELLLSLQSEGWCIEKTFVFKLLPHPYRDSLVKYLGVADGQLHMYIDGTNIIAPYGSQGLYNEYMLATNGRIINIDN